MLVLSSKTQINRKFTLRELYKQISADKTVKEEGKSILSIILSNVLSNDTLNFNGIGAVKEIYVFEVVLQRKEIPKMFISALDKAINLHTFFVLKTETEYCFYGAFKEKTDKGVKIGKYYHTVWYNKEVEKSLPLNLSSLEDVYRYLIDELIPITARKEENTIDFVKRYESVLQLQKEIDALQKQVDSEKQSKKRFELNDRLKEIKKQLKILEG